MNSFTLTAVGNLARNPEAVAKGDITYTRFLLVGNDYAGKDDEGAPREIVTSLWFVAFGALAESLVRSARKGDQLIVEARVRASNWADKQGEKQYDHDFVVKGFRFGAPGKIKREERDARRDEGAHRAEERSNGRAAHGTPVTDGESPTANGNTAPNATAGRAANGTSANTAPNATAVRAANGTSANTAPNAAAARGADDTSANTAPNATAARGADGASGNTTSNATAARGTSGVSVSSGAKATASAHNSSGTSAGAKRGDVSNKEDSPNGGGTTAGGASAGDDVTATTGTSTGKGRTAPSTESADTDAGGNARGTTGAGTGAGAKARGTGGFDTGAGGSPPAASEKPATSSRSGRRAASPPP